MKYKIFADEDILDKQFRVKIIKEIKSAENAKRKEAQKAMLQMLRDKVREFVLQRLAAQGFMKETLAVMAQRASNINLFKKIVSKKARSYSKGVSRTVGENQTATEDMEIVAEAMNLTGAMKKADRYRKAAKNCLLYIYPDFIEDPAEMGKKVLSLCAKVYFPHLYDVIPDASDPEKMRCLILSPFAGESSLAIQPSVGNGDGRALPVYANPIFQADGVDQKIADSPADAGANKREYVWWTAKYHFTTDEQGEILTAKSPSEQLEGKGPKNPIQRIPAVALSEEQDGEFWAEGGEDLLEANILLNLKLTDMEAILHQQGWGQLTIEGEDLKKKDFAVGPQVALIMDTAKGATHKTEAKILSHDPHTEQHMKSAEMHVALCLTTNNLSVKSVATNLEAGSVASAIAKMVDESENMDDVSEDQGYYAGKEKEAMLVAEAWLQTLRETAEIWSVLKEVKPLLVAELNTQFHNQEQVVSEQERLANMKMRKELGIDSVVDLIKKDNPGMSDKQAMAKALKVLNEMAELQQKARAMGLELESGEGGPAPTGGQGSGQAGEKKPPVDEKTS